jgi:hypothetical protein
VLYLHLIILSVKDDVLIDSETFFVTDFVNFKIKLTQSFRDAHKVRVCVYIFIGVSTHTCINIYVYIIFLKKILTRECIARDGVSLASPVRTRLYDCGGPPENEYVASERDSGFRFDTDTVP